MRMEIFWIGLIILMSPTTQSAVLDCNWEPLQQYCNPRNITPVTQLNEVITIDGQPSNYVNTMSQMLGFTSQPINYIPSGLFTVFPNLQHLNMQQCPISLLVTDSLPNCNKLQSLTTRGGTFTSIPAGVFQSCKSLTTLGIGESTAETVDVDAFRGLTNLTTLYLPWNKITCLPPGVFKDMPNLMSLELRDNRLTSIDSNLFMNLPNLSGITLDQNLISYIPKFNFAPSNMSKSISMNFNPIYAISPDICTDLNAYISFGTINCGSNTMPGISSTECQNNPSIYQNCFANWTSTMNNPVPCTVQTTLAPTTAVITTPSPTPGSCPSDKICRYFLDQYNRYTCILDGVDSVLTSISGNHLITFADVNVRRVVFTNSFLSRIPPILFQKFTNLEYLTVSNCSMSAINTNTFTACGNLKYFDASSNFITTIDGASFKSCAALEVIDLTGNNFDMISGQLFVNNPTLKAIYINRPPGMVLI